MTYTTNKTYRTDRTIPPHGGYRSLLSFQTTILIYDLTAIFCRTYLSYKSHKSYTRTRDQMEQAARSGKQNIAEASQVSATSKKTELKLLGVARASLEELLQDYEDYLRQHRLTLWSKTDPRILAIRKLSYLSNRTDKTYMTYVYNPESFANCVICLIHQASYLLDQQIRALEKEFLARGGFTENLYRARSIVRQNQS